MNIRKTIKKIKKKLIARLTFYNKALQCYELLIRKYTDFSPAQQSIILSWTCHCPLCTEFSCDECPNGKSPIFRDRFSPCKNDFRMNKIYHHVKNKEDSSPVLRKRIRQIRRNIRKLWRRIKMCQIILIIMEDQNLQKEKEQ